MLQSPAMLAPTAADLADSEATVPLTDLSRGALKRASETGQPVKRLQPRARLLELGNAAPNATDTKG